MNAQENSSCSSVSLTPPQIKEIAKKTLENLLPDKSKSQYEKEFQKFEEWRRQNNIEGISENILLAYFDLQRQNYKSSTLWRIYSMLRSYLSIAGVQWILVHRHFTSKSKNPRILTPLIILEQTLKYKTCRVLKMVPSSYLFCFLTSSGSTQ
jgi:hypothetical protein